MQGRFEARLRPGIEAGGGVDECLKPCATVICLRGRTGRVEARELGGEQVAPVDEVIELLVATWNRRRVAADLLVQAPPLIVEQGPDSLPDVAAAINRFGHG